LLTGSRARRESEWGVLGLFSPRRECACAVRGGFRVAFDLCQRVAQQTMFGCTELLFTSPHLVLRDSQADRQSLARGNSASEISEDVRYDCQSLP